MKNVWIEVNTGTSVRSVRGFVPDRTNGLFATFLQSRYIPKSTGWSITHRKSGGKIGEAPDLKHALSLIMVLESNPRARSLWHHEWLELKRVSDELCEIVKSAAVKVEKALNEREKTELQGVPSTEPKA